MRTEHGARILLSTHARKMALGTLLGPVANQFDSHTCACTARKAVCSCNLPAGEPQPRDRRRGSGRNASPLHKPSHVSASPLSLKHPEKTQDAGVHAAGRAWAERGCSERRVGGGAPGAVRTSGPRGPPILGGGVRIPMACRAAAQGGFTMSRAAAGTAAGGASPTATPPPRARCSGQPTGPASSPRASRPPASTNLNEMETHLSKEQRKGTTEENDSGYVSEQPSCTSIKKPKQEESLYLTNCRMILTEIENHADAWPFHLPVNLNFVPGYTKVIKKPMDFSTIRN
ncbi:uncharacterized protein LOC118925633 [Manis pentadactyla]|uniref:uncharacterized protein LOC118925633 n=1 Tax=Manis pentadactyla TaxID=143292 RepID=UPI00255CE473|nr:uncharacterized protein LOC118925633 [Manis pentadactyla]